MSWGFAVWLGLVAFSIYGAWNTHKDNIRFKGKKESEEFLEGLYAQYLRQQKSDKRTVKKRGDIIEVKINTRKGWIGMYAYYNTRNRTIEYDANLRFHPLVEQMGKEEMNRWVRKMASEYQEEKPQKTRFNETKWKRFMDNMLTTPVIHKFEQGQFFTKKHYHWYDTRLIVFNYDDGRKRICLFDENHLALEGEYDPKEKRVFVTSDSMLKEPFFTLQEEIIAFLEEFSERENNGRTEELMQEQLKNEVEKLSLIPKFQIVQDEAKELFHYYEKAKEKDLNDYIHMKKSIQYLKGQARKQQKKKEVKKEVVEEHIDEN